MRPTPKGFSPHHHNDFIALDVFLGVDALTAKIFLGKKLKPVEHVRFRTDAERTAWVKDWITRNEGAALAKIRKKEADRALPSPLQVGDILFSSWDCEQTNVDCYKVLERRGHRKVTLVQVASVQVCDPEYSDRGTCVPDPDICLGKPFSAMSDHEGWVKLTSHSGASLAEFDLVNGERVYKRRYWSSYA